MEKEYDVFISYACEDKEVIAAPLARALKKKGFRVWFDDSEIFPGDSLRQSIEIGLRKSKYGIVILSEHFFIKDGRIMN